MQGAANHCDHISCWDWFFCRETTVQCWRAARFICEHINITFSGGKLQIIIELHKNRLVFLPCVIPLEKNQHCPILLHFSTFIYFFVSHVYQFFLSTTIMNPIFTIASGGAFQLLTAPSSRQFPNLLWRGSPISQSTFGKRSAETQRDTHQWGSINVTAEYSLSLFSPSHIKTLYHFCSYKDMYLIDFIDTLHFST